MRFPAQLDSAFAPLEDRTQADLAALARTFAKGLAFWRLSGQLDLDESWSNFLPDLSSLAQVDAHAATCPQKALFLAFLQMYEEAKKELNLVTTRHLEFYYREVLGLAPRGPVPDQAHIVVSLKKTASEVLIPSGTHFKTKDGLEYASELEVVANRADLVHRRILAVDAGTGRLRYAVEAASSDCLGEPLPEEDPAWHTFGHGHTLPNASLGFAVSSPVLLMQEGERTIRLTIALSGLAVSPDTVSASLGAYLSGEREWLNAGSPTEASVERNNQGLLELRLTFELDGKAGSVVAYDPTVLDGGFDTLAPVLKILLLDNAADEVAAALTAAEVDSIRVDVEVTGMKALVLENDFGRLDPAKAFMPFGPSPKIGNSFYINAEEAFVKDVTSVKLHLLWNNRLRTSRSTTRGTPTVRARA